MRADGSAAFVSQLLFLYISCSLQTFIFPGPSLPSNQLRIPLSFGRDIGFLCGRCAGLGCLAKEGCSLDLPGLRLGEARSSAAYFSARSLQLEIEEVISIGIGNLLLRR